MLNDYLENLQAKLRDALERLLVPRPQRCALDTGRRRRGLPPRAPAQFADIAGKAAATSYTRLQTKSGNCIHG
jgi:hypothetical protein